MFPFINGYFNLIALTVLSVVICQNQEKIMKQSKAYSCMLLSRAKIESSPNPKQPDKQAFTNDIVNCFVSIDQDDMSRIIGTLQAGQPLDITDERFSKLIDGSQLEAKYSPMEIRQYAQDIDAIMKEMQREQQRMQGGYEDDDQGEPGNTPGILMKILAGIIKVLAVDGYFGVGVMIVAAFLLLRTLKNLFGTSKKKRTETQEINEDNKKNE